MLMKGTVTAWLKSTRIHCPTESFDALAIHAVSRSPSIAAAGWFWGNWTRFVDPNEDAEILAAPMNEATVWCADPVTIVQLVGGFPVTGLVSLLFST
jgi:hypothetical protein